jgi:hypothetical protein
MRFEITGTHSKVSICHCSLCRKTSGTGSSAAIVVGYDQLTWLTGQELVAGGPKHAFCRVCGAHAPDSNARKTVYIVSVGILDDNPMLQVGQHIYVGSKAHWEVIGEDGAPQFEEDTAAPRSRATPDGRNSFPLIPVPLESGNTPEKDSPITQVA